MAVKQHREPPPPLPGLAGRVVESQTAAAECIPCTGRASLSAIRGADRYSTDAMAVAIAGSIIDTLAVAIAVAVPVDLIASVTEYPTSAVADALESSGSGQAHQTSVNPVSVPPDFPVKTRNRP